MQRQLAQRERVSWSGTPLRQALESLARVQRVAVLLDRRADPGQRLQLRLEGLPLRKILEQIARDRRLGVSMLGPVAYFGPPAASARLRTVAALRTEEIRRAAIGVQQRFLPPKPMTWEDFATPRDLLAELAEQNGLELKGTDRVPHDLWAAADLPPLSLVERLTLILNQFDLTFDASPDGKTITLVPVPDELTLSRDYPGGRDPKALAEKYARLAPEAEVRVVGKRVHVEGLLEDHERITSSRRPSVSPPTAPADGSFANKRFTLRIEEKPAEVVLRGLAEQLKLDLQIDHKALREAGISLGSRVSLSVQDATIDELLREVLEPARLEFRRRGRIVEVYPAR